MRFRQFLFFWFALIGLAGELTGQAAQQEITLPGARLFPESITSTKDGTLIVGSVEQRDILRIAPGQKTAMEWIKPGTGDMNQVFGVLADDHTNTLWVCSDRVRGVGGPDPALKAFSLAAGTLKASYPLPFADAFCNDIAIAPSGAVYITDTHRAAVYFLKPGSQAFETAAQEKLLTGADGIAFTDKNTLCVSDVTTAKLVRLNLGPDGKATKVVELKPSKPLTRPDGMRTLSHNRLALAENGGNVDIVTLNEQDDSAKIDTISPDVDGATAVTVVGKTLWAAEGKLRYWEDEHFIGKYPGGFKLKAFALPKKMIPASRSGGEN